VTYQNLPLALSVFARAREYVLSRNLLAEIEWQRSRVPLEFGETDLLRETSWVILCCGFREAVVRRTFDYISLSFCDWESASSIVAAAGSCRTSALEAINNPRKIDAIVDAARLVNHIGFKRLKRQIIRQPFLELQRFSFIGPVTSRHLAKNLGFQVAKPDRHLVRLCRTVGFADPQELCQSIAYAVGEGVNVVDLILWRYAADGLRFSASPNDARGGHAV
jgi:hypothetical protein